MKSPTYQFALPGRSATPAIESVILYEDLATAINGKVFCELLAEEIADRRPATSWLWRMNILDYPAIAAKASSQAAGSDFIVVSMSGDEDLSSASRQWLESQIRAASTGERFIVLLTHAGAPFPEIAERSREWLSRLCAGAEVDFFAYQGKLTEEEGGVCFIAQEQNGPRVLGETGISSLQVAIP